MNGRVTFGLHAGLVKKALNIIAAGTLKRYKFAVGY